MSPEPPSLHQGPAVVLCIFAGVVSNYIQQLLATPSAPVHSPAHDVECVEEFRETLRLRQDQDWWKLLVSYLLVLLGVLLVLLASLACGFTADFYTCCRRLCG